jgi:hypothetical protein
MGRNKVTRTGAASEGTRIVDVIGTLALTSGPAFCVRDVVVTRPATIPAVNKAPSIPHTPITYLIAEMVSPTRRIVIRIFEIDLTSGPRWGIFRQRERRPYLENIRWKK